MKNEKYTQRGRLVDVIKLISVLAMDPNTFRTEEHLLSAIRTKPNAADSWLEIAHDHSEFFRPNNDGDYIALLLRSYLPVIPQVSPTSRRPFTLEQTQKLIDVAISLHDKEISRNLRTVICILFLFPSALYCLVL